MKYKNKKKEKDTCLYFSNTLLVLLDFLWNEVYFKYTSEFEKK